MGKTTIATNIKKEVTFIGKRGTYRFDFAPDIGDVNKNPDKYQQYLVVRDDVATAPEPTQEEVKEEEQAIPFSSVGITLNGKQYVPIVDNEETIELNGVKYRAV
jgi:hypothetical protein